MSNVKKISVYAAAAMALTAMSMSFAPVQAEDNNTNRNILKVAVLSSTEATQIDLGSKTALGYYGKRNGKCDLTVMVAENGPGNEIVKSSASRVKVAIKPGTSASVESTEGRSVEFFCGPSANRMIVKTFGNSGETPRS